MNFESLPNELLLDLFEYFSSVHLLQAFYNLNIHFNNLIFLYFKNHSFNLQSTSKYNFNLICQKYLPLITNKILLLRLSDDDDTPKQIDLFFSYGLSLQQFSYLQSLTIYRLYSLNLLNIIINQLFYLPHLTHLKILRHTIIYNSIYDIGIINVIEHLSKLIYCNLDIINEDNSYLLLPSIISSSLKYLSISKLDCKINQLIYLIKNISNLQLLNARIVDYSTNSLILSIKFLSIKKLKLIFYGYSNLLNNLLQTMTNLNELKIELQSTYINGYEWKTIIENNLPYLYILQFKMSISNFMYQKEKINEIINSFYDSFWIEKHQWFVQCDWIQNGSIYIYTLPYAFQDFLYKGNIRLASTCPDNNQNWSCNSIQNLYHSFIRSENLSSSYIHLRNIRYLDLSIPFDDSFWSIVSTLNRLNSLYIVLNNDLNTIDIQSKLQILLDKSPNLYSLKYFSWFNENIFPFQLINSSVRQLDLRGANLFYNHQQCKQLSCSLIGQQCQILFIHVKQQIDILYLINHMNNLHALIVKCSMLNENENLVEWLQQHLPPTCAISYSIDIGDDVRLWIR